MTYGAIPVTSERGIDIGIAMTYIALSLVKDMLPVNGSGTVRFRRMAECADLAAWVKPHVRPKSGH